MEGHIIEILFVVNIICLLITMFTMMMLQNHFNKIDRSLSVYSDDKTYKNESDIEFIQTVIERYNKLDQSQANSFDVGILIQEVFLKYKIGTFEYKTIYNIATKAKILLWGILFVQIGIQLMNLPVAYTTSQLVSIVGSMLICIMVTISHIFKNIEQQQKQLFVSVQHYVVNHYPMINIEQQHQKAVKGYIDKINKLERELEKYRQEAREREELMPSIKEQDLKTLLKKF